MASNFDDCVLKLGKELMETDGSNLNIEDIKTMLKTMNDEIDTKFGGKMSKKEIIQALTETKIRKLQAKKASTMHTIQKSNDIIEYIKDPVHKTPEKGIERVFDIIERVQSHKKNNVFKMSMREMGVDAFDNFFYRADTSLDLKIAQMYMGEIAEEGLPGMIARGIRAGNDHVYDDLIRNKFDTKYLQERITRTIHDTRVVSKMSKEDWLGELDKVMDRDWETFCIKFISN